MIFYKIASFGVGFRLASFLPTYSNYAIHNFHLILKMKAGWYITGNIKISLPPCYAILRHSGDQIGNIDPPCTPEYETFVQCNSVTLNYNTESLWNTMCELHVHGAQNKNYRISRHIYN